MHALSSSPLDAKETLGAALVGALSFPATLAVAQAAIFKPLRLTCSQRSWLVSVYGGLSVCAAGFLASLATAKTFSLMQTALPSQKNDSKQTAPTIRASDIIISSLSSVVVFRALGGRFSSVLPSHLLRPGAFAREWVPALRGSQYAGNREKDIIQRLGKRYGCHSCGTKRVLNYICDHQPPTKFVMQNETNGTSFLQQFYPQCNKCSLLQGGLLNGQGTNLSNSKFVRIHPLSLRLYHAFFPLPIALAYLRRGTTDACSNESTRMDDSDGSKDVQNSAKVEDTKDKAVQAGSISSQSKHSLHTVIHDADVNELVANFPLLIIWNSLVRFLDSFHSPGDAFHITVWAFAALAALGTL